MVVSTEIFIFALILTLIAGLSTTIGCLISFLIKEPSPKLISLIMGFSAGVMILISFVELLQEGIKSNGFFMGVMFFFVGMLIMLSIDVLVTHKYEFEEALHFHLHSREHSSSGKENNVFIEELESQHQMGQHRHRGRHQNKKKSINLEKTSLLVFLGVFIHNIPEGMATFVSTLRSVQLGILLATAIALHNIPEGIAVSIPIYTSTKSRKKAFFWSFLSGISEFVGALVFGLIFYQFINDYLLGAMLAIVAGFMVYISLDELLPVAHSLGREHFAILGIMMGMFVMYISLVLL